MELREKAALLALRGALATDINVRDIEDTLMSSGLISRNEKEKIMKAGTTEEQTSTLVDILVEKNNSKTYERLQSSLAKPYPFLKDQMVNYRQNPQTHLKKSSKDYESVFIEGGIPIVPPGNIELKYMVDLKSHLVNLSRRSDGGWILVKGQGGAGKSVMVAQAIRGADVDDNPMAAFFFNRVFWFTIGNLRHEEWESMLLTKMQNICIRLDPDIRNSPPDNLEQAKHVLRTIMLNKYPCGLIVLDDVWEPRILRYFDVEARVIVTSRNADILSRIQRGHTDRCKEISVDEGFTEKATIELLGQMVNAESSAGQVSDQFTEEDLGQIRHLHQKCKGNPFIISIFGGLLRGGLNRFDRYLKKFEQNMLKNVTVESGDYEYTGIMDAILVSIDDLEPEDKDFYLHLVIFPEDSFLSARFLSKFCWRDEDDNPLPVDDASDVMEKFVRRSIATFEQYRTDTPLLTLHDLTVNAMKNEYKEKRTSYNNQFVDRVLEHRKSKQSWLEVEDELYYLAYNFVYHLVSADIVSLDEKLRILRDFDFISWLCCRIGADNLAFVYQYFMKVLKVNEGLEDFVNFFRSPIFRIQATYLATRRSDSAVIQLALTLPEDNYVRQCAENAAKRHDHFFCFYAWLNHNQTEEQIDNTIKVDSDIKNFALDAHCQHAVVASDLSAVILDLTYGTRTYRVRKEEMLPVEAKDNAADNVQVVAALFSPDNKYLFILTEEALLRYRLPSTAFATGIRPSPAPPPASEGSSLHFPEGRPRSATGDTQPNHTHNKHVYVDEDASTEGSFFTAMCFENEAKLLLGSSDGKIRVLTLTDTFINASSDFYIDRDVSNGTRPNHIAVARSFSSPMVAVSGPNDCIYVYESRYKIKKYTGHKSNSNPNQCVFEPREGPTFAASIANNEICLWNPRTLETLVRETGPHITTFTSIAIAADGVYLAVGTSTRAHIYLYRAMDMTEESARLQLVDELNGSGSYTKSLTFTNSGKPFLYSVSEMSTEGVLTRWRANLSATPNRDTERHSSIFFGPESSTLRLRTIFDAVTVEGVIYVACQSVRRSLLILKSTDSSLCNVAKYSGAANQLCKAAAIRLSPNGRYAVFTFNDSVVVATESDGKWVFAKFEEANAIRDIVFLPNCDGFIGSDKAHNLVLYRGNSCVKREILEHKRVLPIESEVFARFGAHALLLSDRSWTFMSPDELKPNESVVGSIDEALPDSILCCDICPLQSGYVAGGTDVGNLLLWQVAPDGRANVVEVRRRSEDGSGNQSLRCVKFSHQIGDFCLLAGAFDDNRFSLWALSDGRLTSLVTCQSVQIGVPLQDSEIGCVGWTSHKDQNGVRHHKLLIASDCVHVCCLPEQEILDRLKSGQTLQPNMVSLYSRQSVMKAQILADGHDLLFVDNSHTVFWMRTLHMDGLQPVALESMPEIPFDYSSEQH